MRTLFDIGTYRVREIDKRPPFWDSIWRRLASLRYVVTTNDATHPFGLEHVFLAGDTQIGVAAATLGANFVNARVMGDKLEEAAALERIDEFGRSLR